MSEFRAAVPSDIDRLVEIEAASNTSPWTRLAFEEEFGRDVSTVVVEECAGAVRGFAVFWLVVDEAHVLNIAVAPEARRQGLGRSLLGECVRQCEAAGGGFMMLEVRESNSAALALYGAAGFKEVSRREGYYRDNGETALVLGLLLGAAEGEASDPRQAGG